MDGCVCLFVPFVLSFKAPLLDKMFSVLTAQSSPPSLLCDLTVIKPASGYCRPSTSCCASIFQAHLTSAHMVLTTPSHNLFPRIIFSSVRDEDWWDDREISSCLRSHRQVPCLGVDRLISKYTFLGVLIR